jgi:hypothetical protein
MTTKERMAAEELSDQNLRAIERAQIAGRATPTPAVTSQLRLQRFRCTALKASEDILTGVWLGSASVLLRGLTKSFTADSPA